MIPWSKILLSIPVWSVVTTNFFFFAATVRYSNYTNDFIIKFLKHWIFILQKGTVINLPLFIRDVLDFSVTEVRIWNSLLFFYTNICTETFFHSEWDFFCYAFSVSFNDPFDYRSAVWLCSRKANIFCHSRQKNISRHRYI